MLLVAQSRQRLARAGAEGLLALRRVDGGNPHLDLLVGPRLAAAGGEGVAVGDGERMRAGANAQFWMDVSTPSRKYR